MTWVQTVSGVAFDLLAPRVEDVRVGDIAHSLARLARYSGHTQGDLPWTVGAHSLLCADIVRVWGGDVRLQREALLHDAGEAYYGDLTSPVKRAFIERVAFAREDIVAQNVVGLLTGPIDRVVREALGLEVTEPALVKRADLVALAIERKLLMAPCERDWALTELADTRWEQLQLHHPDATEWSFNEALRMLDQQLARSTQGAA